ncbi:tRNA nucleotidyltransferase (CCA-adding enzyme) [Colwellia chukchiensis]|uniref:CCA-adding enzyme n=1 Tax=Colwellia chukchiensis TaxID=641665 RepID=A0A1H7J547_9GAMM|nr:multifunctional CCA addition/repair protein [Colwellia chukchiensis]SEK69100.1 tRNA nucleotidyltransferase (CCA-adding enzyme) [Colwellia chukchiensis]
MKNLTKQLNYFLVGGAVRDALLNRVAVDHDYVVVGASVEEMLSRGFLQVGKDFPVFLHPESKQEYALARTEKKSGQGYSGFACYAAPDVTLEQDLLRRDLTINAMARASDGTIIDPYQGQSDLKKRILRHVSPAFVEDPLRVLRVARFAARYHEYGFEIAPETLRLMTEISESGELSTLSGERIWQEMQRSLTEPHPAVFFHTLEQCHAIQALWPELQTLSTDMSSHNSHHNDLSIQGTMRALTQAVLLSEKTTIKFACACYDLGMTTAQSTNSVETSVANDVQSNIIENFCQRMRVPNAYKSLAIKVCQFHLQIDNALELAPQVLLSLFTHLDVWRKPEQFADVLLSCQAIFTARLDANNTSYPQRDFLLSASDLLAQVTAQKFIAQGMQGAAIKAAITQQRLIELSQFQQQFIAQQRDS